MKRLTMFAALLPLLIFTQDFEIKYDKFKDVTYAMTGLSKLKATNAPRGVRDSRLNLICIFKGKQSNTPERCSLRFYVFADEWQFSRSRSVILLVDGERAELGRADRTVDVKGGITQESLSVPIGPALIVKAGGAKIVEMQVGAHEYIAKPDSLVAFGMMAARLTSPK